METLIAIYPEVMSQSAVDAELSPFRLSPFRCDNCSTHITKQNESDSPLWYEESLVECNFCLDLQKDSIMVLPDSASLLQTEVARDAIWFHSTYVENWFEKVTTGQGMEEQREDGDFLYVHVGSENAALDNADYKYFDGYSFSDEPTVMLYQVKLKAGTTLSPHIVNDDETWRDFDSVTEETKSAIGGDAVRYLNRWESPGSISLLVDARQLELVSVERIHNPMKVLSSV